MQFIKQFLGNIVQVRVLLPLAATALWAVSTLYFPSNVASTIYSLLFMLSLPGYVLYRVIAGYPSGELLSRVIIYSVGLSVVSLMGIGLALNQILLALGQTQPLVVPYLVYAIAGFTALLAVLTALHFRQQNLARYRSSFSITAWRKHGSTYWKVRILGALLLLLPVLAVAGAHMLNNGGSNWLALTAMGLVAAALLGLTWTNKVAYQSLYPLGLYSVAAAILLGTSMRGWEITGHDVMQEFQVFQLTSHASMWSMNLYQDAYTACISITILPTILQKLSGLYDPYIFKLVIQLVFALIAPLLYTALRTYAPRKSAFLAAVVFVTFPTFLTDMMMLNRQETAMLLFAMSVAVALDTYLSKPVRRVLMVLLLAGMVLSHYSTSYIVVSILIITTLLALALWLARPLLRKLKLQAFAKDSNVSIFPPYIVALVLLMIVGWSGFATNTAGNISQTIGNIGNGLVKIVNPGSSPSVASVAGPTDTSINGYIEDVQKNLPLPATDYYNDAHLADYMPLELPQASAPVTPLVQGLGVSGDTLGSVYGAVRSGYVGLLAVLLAMGLVVMLWRRSATRLPNQYILLGVGSLLVVVLQVVLPSGAVDYGLTRVIQQGLVVLALPAVVGIVWLLSKLRVKFNLRFRASGVSLILLFLVVSSWLPTLTGGFKPALAFSNSGFYYEAYYTHPDEIRAMQWLATQVPKGSHVYSDEFSRRKMITYAGIFPEPTLIPTAIPVDSYVFLSNGNTTFNEVPVYFNGQLLFYSVPTYFLTTHKSLVYSSGGVQIYR